MDQKLGDGMYDKVKAHDNALVDHNERISNLEENDKQYQERLKQLEDQSIKLENTIMSESRETRTTMKEQTDKLFTIVDQSINYKSDTEKQEHEYRMLKIETWSTVFLKLSGGVVALLSAGGGAYYLLQHFFGGGQ